MCTRGRKSYGNEIGVAVGLADRSRPQNDGAGSCNVGHRQCSTVRGAPVVHESDLSRHLNGNAYDWGSEGEKIREEGIRLGYGEVVASLAAGEAIIPGIAGLQLMRAHGELGRQTQRGIRAGD